MVDWEKGAEAERQKWEKIVEKKDKLIESFIEQRNIDTIALEDQRKLIDKLAEQLTTPLHNKEWVINHFSKLIEEE
jgi:hypothetical protein